jgi:hypothetical protein
VLATGVGVLIALQVYLLSSRERANEQSARLADKERAQLQTQLRLLMEELGRVRAITGPGAPGSAPGSRGSLPSVAPRELWKGRLSGAKRTVSLQELAPSRHVGT